MSTLLKTAVEALNERLEELTPNATPEQLAYLSKSVQNMAGQGTILDIVALTDDKLQELLDAATAHLSNLSNTETAALGQINTAKTDALDDIDVTKVNAQADLVSDRDQFQSELSTAKTQHLGEIDAEGQAQVAAVTAAGDDFTGVNDVPDGSTIMTEVQVARDDLAAINDLPDNTTITEHLGIENGNARFGASTLPFIFGILNRWGGVNGYGINAFTTQLGQWHNSGGNHMLELLTGANAYDNQYISFQKQPNIEFMQGSDGYFVHAEQISRYANSANQYNYPEALLGVIFIKNTTTEDITRSFSFGGASYWNSGYEGASLQLGVPNETDANKENITELTWSVLYSYSSSSNNFSQSVNVTIPAGKTVALLFYTSSRYVTSSGGYQFFQQFYIKNFRSAFMAAGLEIDFERTLKAWRRGENLTAGFQLWN